MKLIFKESIYFSRVQILWKKYFIFTLEKKLETQVEDALSSQ